MTLREVVHRLGRAFQFAPILLPLCVLLVTAPVLEPPLRLLREADGKFARKEFALALDGYASLATVAPRSALPHLRLGQVHLAKARYDEAQAEYDKALALDPGSIQALAGLGSALVEAGRYGESIFVLQRALAGQPGLAEARYHLGLALMRSNNVAQAGEQFQVLLAQAGDSSHHRLWRQRTHYRLAQIVLSERPDVAVAHLQEAASDQADAEVAEQAALLLPTARAVSLHQDRPAYAAALAGQALLRVQETSLARQQLEKAVGLDPSYVDALAYLGYAYWLGGAGGKAVDVLARAVALEPRAPVAQYFLGFVLARMDRLEAALVELERAARLDPDNTYLWIELAGVLAARGDYARAEVLFERAGGLATDSADVQLLVAKFYLDRFYMVEQGLAVARAAAEKWPENAEVASELGWALYVNRRPEDARDALRKAVQLAPDLPEPHYRLGVVLEQLGGLAEAAVEYRRAVDLDRGTKLSERAREALRGLGGR
ncbi:MAG: tetratricopeptide repeat protein [Chloroflexi bacterium]|nr:tetratricopeptide repeat protein [Chloroflexota bacterium]